MKRRSWFPDSLVGRTMLVLIAGLALSQLASIVFFSLSREDLTARLAYRQLAERIVSNVQMIEESDEIERNRILRAARREGFYVRFSSEPWANSEDRNREVAAVLSELKKVLVDQTVIASLGSPPSPMLLPDDAASPQMGMRGMRNGHGFMRHDGMPPQPLLTVSIKIGDGSWVNFVSLVDIPDTSGQSSSLLTPLLVGLFVVLALSILAVWSASKPLAVLANAAERLGRDVGAPPVPVQGPREVRSAALAFNNMQLRLKRFIDDRTQMIAAISHDLRTPITRMKLRAEFIEDDETRNKMLSDLDEMEAMIKQTLAFGRDDSAREPRSMTDLAAMLIDLCRHFGNVYLGPDHLDLLAGPISLKRALTNLLENAHKYGNQANIRLEDGKDAVLIIIDDEGPGLQEPDMERVFQPFFRLESSRNRDTGGTGLGLAIARSAIRAHGGDILLSNRPEGGLRATVTLPR